MGYLPTVSAASIDWYCGRNTSAMLRAHKEWEWTYEDIGKCDKFFSPHVSRQAVYRRLNRAYEFIEDFATCADVKDIVFSCRKLTYKPQWYTLTMNFLFDNNLNLETLTSRITLDEIEELFDAYKAMPVSGKTVIKKILAQAIAFRKERRAMRTGSLEMLNAKGITAR